MPGYTRDLSKSKVEDVYKREYLTVQDLENQYWLVTIAGITGREFPKYRKPTEMEERVCLSFEKTDDLMKHLGYNRYLIAGPALVKEIAGLFGTTEFGQWLGRKLVLFPKSDQGKIRITVALPKKDGEQAVTPAPAVQKPVQSQNGPMKPDTDLKKRFEAAIAKLVQFGILDSMPGFLNSEAQVIELEQRLAIHHGKLPQRPWYPEALRDALLGASMKKNKPGAINKQLAQLIGAKGPDLFNDRSETDTVEEAKARTCWSSGKI